MDPCFNTLWTVYEIVLLKTSYLLIKTQIAQAFCNADSTDNSALSCNFDQVVSIVGGRIKDYLRTNVDGYQIADS